MTLRQILTTMAGVRAGLDYRGNLVLNRKDGSQIVLDANATTGVPSVYTQTAAGAAAQYDMLTSAQAAAVAKVPAVAANSSSSGFANSDAIQTYLVAGNVVYIPPGLGDVYCGKTLKVPCNGSLIVGAGTWLKKIPSVQAYHLVHNVSAQCGSYVNGTTISGGFLTIIDPGHSYKVGDVVYCENFKTNLTLNGAKTVTAVVEGVSWTFAASGANPGNTAVQVMFHSIYNPLSYTNFVRNASNVVTVTETGHKRQAGDAVWIAGLATDTSFNGAYAIVSVVDGVSWTYASVGSAGSPTGTAHLLGDYEITVDLRLDGNYPNLSGGSQWGNHGSMFGNVGRFNGRLSDAVQCHSGRGMNFFNARGVDIPFATAHSNTGVCIQFDSYCDRVHVGTVNAIGNHDDALAWGVTDNGSAYGDTTSPTGPGSMGRLTVDNIMGTSATGLFKSYAAATYNAGSMNIGKVVGIGCIAVGDAANGTGGGTFSELNIGIADNVPYSLTVNQIAFGIDAWAQMGAVSIGQLNDNTAIGGVDCLNITGKITSFYFGNITSLTARTTAAIFAIKQTGTAHTGTITINGLKSVSAANGASQTPVVSTDGGNALRSLRINNWTHNGTGVSDCRLIYTLNGGMFDHITISDFDISGVSTIFDNNTASIATTITMTDGVLDTIGSAITAQSAGTGAYTVKLNNVNATNIANNLIQPYYASHAWRIRARNVSHPAGKFCLMSGNWTGSIDGDQTVKIDLGANGGTIPTPLVPLAGDQLWNSNATGPGLYSYKATATAGYVLMAAG